MKKSISWVLTCCVILSAIVVLAGAFTTALAEDVCWNGTVAASYAGGTGTESDPYQIENGAQLAHLLNDSATADKYYAFTKDIYLNDVSVPDWKTRSPRQWIVTSTAFQGTLDGDGHTVYGLYYNGSSAYVGLISRTRTATIRNIRLADASLTTTADGLGGLVGFSYGGSVLTVSGCCLEESVELVGTDGVAGIVGYGAPGIYVSDCAIYASLAGTKFVSAISGDCWWSDCSHTISNCVTSSDVPFETKYTTTLSGCYGTVDEVLSTAKSTVLSRDAMMGDAAADVMPSLDWENVWQTTSSYPTLRQFVHVWDGSVAVAFAGGTGTDEDPYRIATPEQLAYLVKNGSTGTKYYVLTEDIRLNDTSSEHWTDTAAPWFDYTVCKNAAFSGNFDGQNHTISGLYYNGSSSSALFPVVSGTVNISNVTVTDSSLTTDTSGGAVAVFAAFSGARCTFGFNRCQVSESVALKGVFAAGYVGFMDGPVVNVDSCSFFGSIAATDRYGAFFSTWNGGVNVNNSIASVTFGVNGTYKITDSYCTASCGDAFVVSAAEMQGETASEELSALDWNTTWKTTAGYPVLRTSGADLPHESELDPDGIWDGVVAQYYASGSGTQSNPYVIESGRQLAKLVRDPSTAGKFYRLACDINLNDPKKALGSGSRSWYDNTTVNGVVFSGNFDGQGHTIRGLYYNGAKYFGLFPMAKSATIQNVTLADSDIRTSGQAIAAFVGYAQYNGSTLTFSRCYVDESVTITGSLDAAGLASWGIGTINVNTCGVTARIAGTTNVSSLIGDFWSATITMQNSYGASGYPLCAKWDFTASDCYNTVKEVRTVSGNITVIPADKMLGEAAKTNMPKLDWRSGWVTTKRYPKFKYVSTEGVPGEVWSGGVANAYAGGKGTLASPYEIATAEQLAYLVSGDRNTSGKYYCLTEDIRLNDTSADWQQNDPQEWFTSSNAATFSGTVDGKGHIVSGMYLSRTAPGSNYAVGLFPRVSGAVMMNIGIADAYIDLVTTGSDETYVGALIGLSSGATVTACYAEESVVLRNDKTSKSFIGGLIGGGAGGNTVDSSYFAGSLFHHPDARHGAILGNVWGGNKGISNCYGIGCVLNSYNGASVTGKSNYGTVSGDAVPGTTVLKPEQMLGKEARGMMANFDWKSTWLTTERYPTLRVVSTEGIPGEVWTGRVAVNFAGGKGTKKDPYQIATGEQLAKLVSNMDDYAGNPTTDVYYKLVNDIYLNDVSDPNWEENANQWYYANGARSSNFRGHFDGDYHVVYGLYLNAKTDTNTYTGLFPAMSDGADVQKVGLSHAHLKVEREGVNTEKYAGGIAGYLFFNQSDEETDPEKLPYITQCFGDTTVELESYFCGGMVGGAPRPATIDNCYFVGVLNTDQVKRGGMIGNSWTTFKGATVSYCYTATNNNDQLSQGVAGVDNSGSSIHFEHNYCTGKGLASAQTMIGMTMMRGDKALTNMKDLDFENIWATVPNGTPVLRGFGTTDKFSNTNEPKPICVTFVANGGSESAPVYGNPEDPLKLPVPTRDGYKFVGWYVFRELDIPFDISYFPYYDQTLYAKWEPRGLMQDFEQYPNSTYDVGKDYEYYRPGVAGYDAVYAHGGIYSMHRIGNLPDESDFLVLYEETLTPGQEYEMTFYVTTDKEGTSADIFLVMEDYPDIMDSNSGVLPVKKLTAMQKGKWIKVTYTFVAKTRWVALRTSGNASLFFDEVMFVATDSPLQTVGDTTKTYGHWEQRVIAGDSTTTSTVVRSTPKTVIVKRVKKGSRGNETNGMPWWLLLLVILLAVLIIVGFSIFLILKRKKKKKVAASE